MCPIYDCLSVLAHLWRKCQSAKWTPSNRISTFGFPLFCHKMTIWRFCQEMTICFRRFCLRMTTCFRWFCQKMIICFRRFCQKMTICFRRFCHKMFQMNWSPDSNLQTLVPGVCSLDLIHENFLALLCSQPILVLELRLQVNHSSLIISPLGVLSRAPSS